MLKQLKKFTFVTAIAALTACGFHFQNGQLIPQELQTLTLESSDQYSDMAMAMRKQLQLNNINLVEASPDVPVLRLNKTSTDDEVVSVFKQGREAEKMLMLEVSASVKMPNRASYPISAKVNRTFFDNSRAALAKSSEKEIIWNDMREQAARQLISKMVALQHQIKNDKQ
ncbi:LPS-assembly lipoprotein LptE [Basfia succiniciproducens]|uniref:LPS-assembly lipoprotein LptE n=1 Tax=Basfia succiniciproducens TaxID=653940 RepID=UPI0008D5CA85|nr:LPS assembly lipoprotein LptE [Basfia succiniciproducens]SEQ03632.1 LPS-assembly lipoprotein [Basfia succiniciproducens]